MSLGPFGGEATQSGMHTCHIIRAGGLGGFASGTPPGFDSNRCRCRSGAYLKGTLDSAGSYTSGADLACLSSEYVEKN
jgi:hypothetical protein